MAVRLSYGGPRAPTVFQRKRLAISWCKNAPMAMDRATRMSLVDVFEFRGQVTKGARWMPRRRKAMKDVADCDKPREAVSRL